MTEDDVSAHVDIMWEAFRPDLMSLMYPHGFSPAAREYDVRSYLKQWQTPPDTIKMMKVIDTDLPDDAPFNKIVGTARWRVYPDERSAEEMEAEKRKKDTDDNGMPPDCDVEMMKDFNGAVARTKMEVIGGRPHVKLAVMMTLPEHQRRGVGAIQLRWGLEEADKLGLPVYLESSLEGKRLYERMGFESVKQLPFDSTKWNPQMEVRQTVMIRPAKGAPKGSFWRD